MAGRWFEGFTAGEVIRHDIRRTVTEADNVIFTTMTMNPAAIHLDHAHSAQTEFGRPLVNSLFTLGLVVGISVHETTLGTTVGNLGFEEVRFPAPVFTGDTIRVETEVAAARESRSRPGQGIVTFVHRGYNQDGALVCEARRGALMLKAPAEGPEGAA
jgi:acyl dehydratase